MLSNNHSFVTLLVFLVSNCNTYDHVTELNLTSLRCQNWNVVWIPRNEFLTFLKSTTIFNCDDCTDNEVMCFYFKTIFVLDRNYTILIKYNEVTF